MGFSFIFLKEYNMPQTKKQKRETVLSYWLNQLKINTFPHRIRYIENQITILKSKLGLS